MSSGRRRARDPSLPAAGSVDGDAARQPSLRPSPGCGGRGLQSPPRHPRAARGPGPARRAAPRVPGQEVAALSAMAHSPVQSGLPGMQVGWGELGRAGPGRKRATWRCQRGAPLQRAGPVPRGLRQLGEGGGVSVCARAGPAAWAEVGCQSVAPPNSAAQAAGPSRAGVELVSLEAPPGRPGPAAGLARAQRDSGVRGSLSGPLPGGDRGAGRGARPGCSQAGRAAGRGAVGVASLRSLWFWCGKCEAANRAGGIHTSGASAPPPLDFHFETRGGVHRSGWLAGFRSRVCAFCACP
ncbi:hypothetical protein NN561_011589 [Cricetulus griseus]